MASGGKNYEKMDELLACLRKHGVEEFSDGSVTVRFSSRAHYRDPLIDNVEPDIIHTDKADELTDEELKFYSA